MIKILVINNLYPPYVLGGYEILCSQVVDELKVRGYKVVVLTSLPPSDDLRELDPKTCKYEIRELQLIAPFNRAFVPSRIKKFWTHKYNYSVSKAVIKRENPDLILIWSQLRLTLGPSLSAEESGIPCVYMLNDEYLTGYQAASFSLRPRKFASFLLDRLILSYLSVRDLSLSHAVCVSKSLKDSLIKKGISVQNAKVIYQGIPIEQFPMKGEPGKVHLPIRILYVGQIHPYKGIHTLLESLIQLNLSARRNFILSIVGEGSEGYQNQLKKTVNDLLLPVTFFGKVPYSETGKYYRDHDILVFPSVWKEPFGLTHLEAMASGTPVISSSGGGQDEFLEDGKNCLLFQKEDAKDLARCINKLSKDEELRMQIIINARHLIESQFTLKKYVDRLEFFIKQLMR